MSAVFDVFMIIAFSLFMFTVSLIRQRLKSDLRQTYQSLYENEDLPDDIEDPAFTSGETPDITHNRNATQS